MLLLNAMRWFGIVEEPLLTGGLVVQTYSCRCSVPPCARMANYTLPGLQIHANTA